MQMGAARFEVGVVIVAMETAREEVGKVIWYWDRLDAPNRFKKTPRVTDIVARGQVSGSDQ